MDGDKMCRGDTPLQRTFSIDHMNMTRIECVLQGTDDNGHKLSARASVELVKRYPEDAQPQETLVCRRSRTIRRSMPAAWRKRLRGRHI